MKQSELFTERVDALKKYFLLFVFLMILLLSACQLKEILFVGEGENWTAEVTVNQTKGDETYQIQLNYKGNNVAEIETFSYYVDTIKNGIVEFGTNEAALDGKGVYHNRAYSSNSPSTRKDAQLVIKVEWNDKSETFNLKSE